jgi:endogenous inhibitor of DNA gyrase (YacG/DUF329 family)
MSCEHAAGSDGMRRPAFKRGTLRYHQQRALLAQRRPAVTNATATTTSVVGDAEQVRCTMCGNQFESYSGAGGRRFCSGNCATMHRVRSGVDDIDCTCPVCGAAFRKNRYARKETCGRRCGAVLRARRKARPRVGPDGGRCP